MGHSRTYQVVGGQITPAPPPWLAHGAEEGADILKEKGSRNPVLWLDPGELILCFHLQSLNPDSAKDLSSSNLELPIDSTYISPCLLCLSGPCLSKTVDHAP